MVEFVPLIAKLTRGLARIRGARVLLEPLVRSFGRRGGEYEMDSFDGGARLKLRLNEHMEARIFWFGSYSRDVLHVLHTLLRRNDVFVDVGANIGEITVFAARRVGPGGRVLAIEPYAPTLHRLGAHVTHNGLDQVDVVECALGKGEGSLEFFASEQGAGDGLAHSGMHTVFRSEDRSVRLAPVELTSLDRLAEAHNLQRIDGLKIDVEGGELDVLRGARTVLSKFRPWIVLEVNGEACRAAGYSSADLLTFLTELGYTFERIRRGGALEPIAIGALADFQNVLCRCRQ